MFVKFIVGYLQFEIGNKRMFPLENKSESRYLFSASLQTYLKFIVGFCPKIVKGNRSECQVSMEIIASGPRILRT